METLILFAISIVAYFIFKPDPQVQNAERPGLDDFDVPIAKEGVEIAAIFGTCDLSSSNVVNYGDLRQVAIKKSGGKK